MWMRGSGHSLPAAFLDVGTLTCDGNASTAYSHLRVLVRFVFRVSRHFSSHACF